ncbi:MAG: 1-acyl-sn-glycerol-3-phosphate acyltransferase [Chloroflexi bacterium]|nr:1-acyl-sn-glycerol-3-phosphate acyltransferase [Chloroflexota bacterium]
MTTYAPVITHQHTAHPHTWQTQLWARIVRRAGRQWVLSRHIDRFLLPLIVDGREHLAGVRGPVIVMPNHSSHFDTPAALSVLPERIRARTAVAAAADKFYRPGKKGWWYSLFFNAFPIERGSGSAALDYAKTLLSGGWSILMYPEGTRSVNGEMARFHHGVSLLALGAGVPVVPIYMEGLRDVMPKGQREPRPAAVRIRIGAPVRIQPGTSVPDGTAQLERAVRELAGLSAVAA